MRKMRLGWICAATALTFALMVPALAQNDPGGQGQGRTVAAGREDSGQDEEERGTEKVHGGRRRCKTVTVA